MKKIMLAINFILLLTLLVGCTGKKSEQDTGTKDISNIPTPTIALTEDITNPPEITPAVTDVVIEEPLTIEDYYPFRENTQYSYEGVGNEYATFHVFTDYTDQNHVQQRINNGGSELVKVLENKNGQLTMLLSRGESYYRENLINKTDENPEIILKEPLVAGTEWTLSDNRKRYISNTEVSVTTDLGTYLALEVTTEGKDDKVIDYYAPHVGLVKTVYTSNDMEVTSTLNKIEEDVPNTQIIRFYYPNVDEDTIYPVDKQISFKTNDDTGNKLVEAAKETTKKVEPMLSGNVKINSLYLNDDNVVYVDFSKELVTEMNAGSGYETLILQCITNTLGNYYGVTEVKITLDGNLYESGHYMMKENETFKVNMENVVE